MRLSLAALGLGVISILQPSIASAPYSLRYGTYLGGRHKDSVKAIAVDIDGNAYVGGTTLSTDFPSTPGVFLRESGVLGDDYAGFVAKLSQDGRLIYSTLLRGRVGGLLRTFVNAIAVDRRGNAYAAGSTCSTDFPTTPKAFQRRAPGPGSNLLEPCDAFVVKLDRTGSHLLYATYLGGSGADSATSIWLDAEGNAYVAGYTSSADFPVTQDAVQHHFGGAIDGFLVILDSEGRRLRYATFLGGRDRDEVAALVGDSQGNLYLTGATRSSDFPSLERHRKASSYWDTFLLKMATGARRLSGLRIGGSGDDVATSIAIAQNGDIYVAGSTASRDFPITPNALAGRFRGGTTDAFWARVAMTASSKMSIACSSLLGGSDDNHASGIGVDDQGSVFVAGSTASSDFPITRDAFRGRLDRNDDGFLVKIRRDGAQLQFGTFVGGGHNRQAWGNDGVSALAIGRNGDVYIVGGTTSEELPVTSGSAQSRSGGNSSTLTPSENPALQPFRGNSVVICSAP